MRVEFRPAARQELLDAADWYRAEGGPGVAEQFGLAMEHALQLLGRMPRLGTPIARQLRVWSLRHFPYSLVYRVQGERLTVLAVAHQRRAPTYWVGRG